eukprot:TRINITY_DN9854_c0_g1_i1.p1 TRINITY_DN9854_c0_g1~~TRINITY_DN9854_c0_g1_i1.p1  ORF type:complete len:119 (-),score=2.48 TRINITY_DN9854_c0_g1_i1:263-619(-)
MAIFGLAGKLTRAGGSACVMPPCSAVVGDSMPWCALQIRLATHLRLVQRVTHVVLKLERISCMTCRSADEGCRRCSCQSPSLDDGSSAHSLPILCPPRHASIGASMRALRGQHDAHFL